MLLHMIHHFLQLGQLRSCTRNRQLSETSQGDKHTINQRDEPVPKKSSPLGQWINIFCLQERIVTQISTYFKSIWQSHPLSSNQKNIYFVPRRKHVAMYSEIQIPQGYSAWLPHKPTSCNHNYRLTLPRQVLNPISLGYIYWRTIILEFSPQAQNRYSTQPHKTGTLISGKMQCKNLETLLHQYIFTT